MVLPAILVAFLGSRSHCKSEYLKFKELEGLSCHTERH